MKITGELASLSWRDVGTFARGIHILTKQCSIWYDLKAYLLLSRERKKWSSYTIPALWLLPRTISGPEEQGGFLVGRFLNKIHLPGPELVAVDNGPVQEDTQPCNNRNTQLDCTIM